MFLSIFMFLAVTVGFVAAYQLLTQYFYPDRFRVRSRLEKEFDTTQPAETASPLFQTMDNLQLPMPSETTTQKQEDRVQQLKAQLRSMLQQVGIPLSPLQLALVSAGSGLLVGIVVLCFAGVWFGAASGLISSAVPFVIIYRRIKARREKLLHQLPAAFELMSRVMRAGGSVTQALHAVIDGFEDPLSVEFMRCQKHLELGLSPEVVYQDLAQRCGNVEMRLFVMAMTIQRQTGGNLSEVLERLAGLVRARLRLRQQVLTLTSEGRLQGIVLTIMPFCLFAVMSFLNADYAKELFEHMTLVTMTLIGMAIGTLWIRRIVHFDY